MLESGSTDPAGLLRGPVAATSSAACRRWPRLRRSSWPAVTPLRRGRPTCRREGCRTSGPAPCPASRRRTSPRVSGCTSVPLAAGLRRPRALLRRGRALLMQVTSVAAATCPRCRPACAVHRRQLPPDWQDIARDGTHARSGADRPASRRRPELVGDPSGHGLQQLHEHRPATCWPRRTSSCASGPTRCGSSGRVRNARSTSIVYHDRASGVEERLRGRRLRRGRAARCGRRSCSSTRPAPTSPTGSATPRACSARYLHDHPKEWWSFDTDEPLPRLSPAGYLTRRPYEASRPAAGHVVDDRAAPATATACSPSRR